MPYREVWYDPDSDTIEIWYQRMMDEWVFEAVGFYSPRFSYLTPYAIGLTFIGYL